MGQIFNTLKNAFKKSKKFWRILFRGVKWMVIILIIYIISLVAVRETIKTLDYFVKTEQERDLTRFEDKLQTAKEHLQELQEQLKIFESKKYYHLTTQQKTDILKTAWELRKDSWRIKSAWLNHQNDTSVNLYPRRNEQIANKFKDYWQTHILIDRVVDDLERIIYSPQQINKFQLQKLKEDLENTKNNL